MCDTNSTPHPNLKFEFGLKYLVIMQNERTAKPNKEFFVVKCINDMKSNKINIPPKTAAKHYTIGLSTIFMIGLDNLTIVREAVGSGRHYLSDEQIQIYVIIIRRKNKIR